MVRCPWYVDEVVGRLEENGERAFVVGGSLRDIVLGVEPHDYDVATSALPERTAEIFKDKRVVATGIKHGTVTVILDGEAVEITTFRIDGEYSDARHPDSVEFTDDIIKDLSRRDFTVNAMAYSKSRGLVDPFDGQKDIASRTIRAVRDPYLRFSEDALRIMRAFRFSAQLGFEIEENTLKGALATKEGLVRVARERIGNEFLRLVTSSKPCRPLELMADGGIFEYVTDGYIPSKELIYKIERLPASNTERMALLLFDADKQTAKDILLGLRMSGKQITATLATHSGAQMRVSTPEDARRLIACTGIYAVSAARVSELLGVSPEGAADLTERQLNTPCSVRELKINGKDLAVLGLAGKDIGEMLVYLLERVIKDPTLNDRDTLLMLAKQLKG